MKKISMIVVVVMIALFTASFSLASGEISADTSQSSIQETSSEPYKLPDEVKSEKGNASKTTLKNLASKDEKIRKYTEALGGNKTNGTVLYYLYEVQKYSIPVCFVGLVIASLNFFIIGNKKLDKREQGFRMLVSIIVGLIVFQVLPLLFAIIVAGR